jgi:tRNA(fMet)-specific endonuclease VapC
MLLDTSFLIDLMDGRPEAVTLAAAIDAEGDTLRIPAPVLYELWVGAARAGGPASDRHPLAELETAYEVVGFELADARAAGTLQSVLRRSGMALGTIDVQVAGMALARSEGVVTGDSALAGVGHGVSARTYRRKIPGPS